MAEPLKVLFLASEADPLIKVGGLGDVAGSLPSALRALDPSQIGGRSLDVRLVMPFHSAIRSKLDSVQLVASFEIPHANGDYPAEVYYSEVNRLPVYLIAGPLFSLGEPVYSSDNYRDGLKYTFFSLAALKMTQKIGWRPNILHANDWHTGITPYLSRYSPEYPELNSIPSILTVHNLPFMGAGADRALDEFGIPPILEDGLPGWARQMPLPLGLASADRVIAVSPSYAQEILTPEFGCGLEGYLQSRGEAVGGILNGLDIESWNPAADTGIPGEFDLMHLDAREKNREALMEEVGLSPRPGTPLMIIISRMDQQKGIDLAIEALYQVRQYPWQAIVLGTGSPLLEASCKLLQDDFPDRVRAFLRFDGQFARRMYAGGDMILMPSRYEPCGLAQMIAMRYGCVPVARSTGGLRDTIQDFPSPGATGFLFEDATSQALADTLIRAIATFPDRPTWQQLQQRGMQMDFSWKRSALVYAQVYRSL